MSRGAHPGHEKGVLGPHAGFLPPLQGLLVGGV
jgi:hypothetical protein